MIDSRRFVAFFGIGSGIDRSLALQVGDRTALVTLEIAGLEDALGGYFGGGDREGYGVGDR